MRLFFDEDRGKGVATALHAVGVPTMYVGPGMAVEKGTPDEVWIPRAGHNSWLVITGNQAILQAEAQRRLWIEHKVGGVFLTSNRLTSLQELRLLLRKLNWLITIDTEVPRPFAFMLSPGGRTTRVVEIG